MKGDFLNNDTIIAPITGLTGGSVHLLRISGKNTIPLVNRFFSRNILNEHGNQFFYGQLVNEKNKPIDDVILLVYRSPNSYTGEDVIEISCHANLIITEEIIALFINNGCRLAEPGEFTKRAFLNGKIDLIQAESVAELISAKSKQAVENALNQLDGNFSKELKEIKQKIIDSLSLLELNLDFSEEDIEVISDQQILKLLNEIEKKIKKYIDSYKQGKLLQNGIKVLITGKPNVGKSSLMNALLKKDRVLVSDIPGTTRDIVHEEFYLDDILIKLLDTAGIRYSGDYLEQEGVKRAKELYKEADFILMMFDASDKFDDEDFYLFEFSKNYKDKIIFIANKIDLGIEKHNIKYINNKFIKISVKEKTNIDLIKKELKKRIHIADSESIFLTTERQFNKLKEMYQGIKRAKKTLKDKIGHEFVAMELREIINILAELTGEIKNEDILNNIFSNFCIGK